MSASSLYVLTLALAACSGGREPSEPATAPPRHLILLTIDTLRADHVSSSGGAPRARAKPGSAAGSAVEDLAAQSVRFPRAFAPRGMTFPSIATLFTGCPPLETCALSNGDTLPDEARTLAERLTGAGFLTAAFTTNRLLVPRSGIEQGFAHFFTDASPERDLHAIDAAIAWIAAQDVERGPPLFVWIHLTGPHLPYDPTPLDGIDFKGLYTDPSYRGEADGSRAFLDRAHGIDRELSPPEVAHAAALYAAEVARIDHLVGRFARFLSGADASQPVDLLARSLFVFTADHGEELYERNRYFGHAKSVYGAVLHVPLFLRTPAARSATVDALVELEDLLPTLLETFGLETDPALRGRSLARALDPRAETKLEPQPAFGLWSDRIFTVRSERWRLVWNPDGVEPDDPPPGRYPIPKIALYDLTVDPHETSDVSAAHPEVVSELQQSIREWRAGLVPCATAKKKLSPERLQALKDLGYAGEDH